MKGKQMAVPFLRQNQILDQMLSQELRAGPLFLDQMGKKKDRELVFSLGMARKLVPPPFFKPMWVWF